MCFSAERAAVGLCAGPDETSASTADREEPQRPHRPGVCVCVCVCGGRGRGGESERERVSERVCKCE